MQLQPFTLLSYIPLSEKNHKNSKNGAGTSFDLITVN